MLKTRFAKEGEDKILLSIFYGTPFSYEYKDDTYTDMQQYQYIEVIRVFDVYEKLTDREYTFVLFLMKTVKDVFEYQLYIVSESNSLQLIERITTGSVGRNDNEAIECVEDYMKDYFLCDRRSDTESVDFQFFYCAISAYRDGYNPQKIKEELIKEIEKHD